MSGELHVGPLPSPPFQSKSNRTPRTRFTCTGSFRQTSGRTRNTSFCFIRSNGDHSKGNTDSFFATQNNRGPWCIIRPPSTASGLRSSFSYREWRKISKEHHCLRSGTGCDLDNPRPRAVPLEQNSGTATLPRTSGAFSRHWSASGNTDSGKNWIWSRVDHEFAGLRVRDFHCASSHQIVKVILSQFCWFPRVVVACLFQYPGRFVRDRLSASV